MSSRVLPALVLLVLGSSLAMAAIPCKTEEEAMADAVAGFFLMQRVAAARCDEALGGSVHRDLDTKVRHRYQTQIDAATKVREAYFKRSFGPKARKEQAQLENMLSEMVSGSVMVDPHTCGKLRDELERRHAGGWEPIRERLVRRTQAIPREQQNLCRP